MNKLTGIEEIAEERQRQVTEEGWTPEHDALHSDGALALAGASYATAEEWRKNGVKRAAFWPFDEEYWKPTPEDRVRELVKAGQFIVSEIDRLNSMKK